MACYYKVNTRLYTTLIHNNQLVYIIYMYVKMMCHTQDGEVHYMQEYHDVIHTDFTVWSCESYCTITLIRGQVINANASILTRI